LNEEDLEKTGRDSLSQRSKSESPGNELKVEFSAIYLRQLNSHNWSNDDVQRAVVVSYTFIPFIAALWI
jgi:hypothetical protein